MFCPIKSREKRHTCDKEECAWYDKNEQQCVIMTFSETAKDISEVAHGQRIIFTREA